MDTKEMYENDNNYNIGYYYKDGIKIPYIIDRQYINFEQIFIEENLNTWSEQRGNAVIMDTNLF